ncbi:GIY-YIG nuclease family protein [Alistipes sp.]|uniref:GIY-YIG nuclease family protein n=1 Tax=Alistipes sp. TaxID=1872444 RepID=UPI003AEF4436
MKGYYVYILTNSKRTVLYTGVTDNLTSRLNEHRQMRPGSFTSRYGVDRVDLF